MFVKLVFLICYISGTYAQIRPSCRQIDFNYEASLDEFEPCEFLNVFGIKSYADVPFESYRGAENHLSNIYVGFSCFRTKQIFNLDIYTEFDSTIYLNSSSEDIESYVEILAFDTEEGDLHLVGTVEPSDEWNYFSVVFGRNSANAQIEIHAYTSADAQLAIEYMHILRPGKAEAYCTRTTTTTTTTTTSTTTTTIEPETDPPTTEAETDPPTTETETDPPTTEAGTDPPTTEAETDPPTTEPETDPPTTEAETDPPTTEAETDPPTTEPETDPPTTEAETDHPTTEAETYPPTTEPQTDPPTTEAETDPPTTEAETDPPTTEPETDPPTTEPETDPPTTEAETDPPTTEAETDSSTTEAETDPPNTQTEPQPTEIPTYPNENSVWIILSFTFFLTTIIAAATLLYLIYLYKVAVVASTSLLKAPATTSTLPRLTVTNTNGGEHAIVGIGNGYNSTTIKPKYF